MNDFNENSPSETSEPTSVDGDETVVADETEEASDVATSEPEAAESPAAEEEAPLEADAEPDSEPVADGSVEVLDPPVEEGSVAEAAEEVVEAARREYWNDDAPKPQSTHVAGAVADETGEPQNASGVKVHPASLVEGNHKIS